MGEGMMSGGSSSQSKEISKTKEWEKDVTPKIVQSWQALPIMKASQSQPADIVYFKF